MTRILKAVAFACTLSAISCAPLLEKSPNGYWVAYVDTELNANLLAEQTCKGDYEVWEPEDQDPVFPRWYFRCL